MTTTETTDWLTLAGQAGTPYMTERLLEDPGWAQWLYHQAGRAMWFLAERLDTAGADAETVTRRAAVILNADPEAPELERMLGVRLAVHLEGQSVKCRGCRRKWTCIPEDPYYDAADAASGLCGTCMLAGTRTDAAVPVIEPTAVIKPQPPIARARKRTAGPAPEKTPG